jgi:hypothetical protein
VLSLKHAADILITLSCNWTLPQRDSSGLWCPRN